MGKGARDACVALAAWLLAASMAPMGAASHPYVQSELYVGGVQCCTFGAELDDVSVRVAVLDVTRHAGLRVGALVDLHDANHGSLDSFGLCGESGAVALPPGTEHIHVALYDALSNQALCGLASGVGAVAGTVEARMNGA